MFVALGEKEILVIVVALPLSLSLSFPLPRAYISPLWEKSS